MPKLEWSFLVPIEAQRASRYVADLRNVPRWDPSVIAALPRGEPPSETERRSRDPGTSDGPQEGDEFDLVVDSSWGRTILPYRLAEATAHRVVLEGKTRLFKYRDVIEFAREGAQTRVTYRASRSLRGPLSLGNVKLRRVLEEAGTQAMRGLERQLGDLE